MRFVTEWIVVFIFLVPCCSLAESVINCTTVDDDLQTCYRIYLPEVYDNFNDTWQQSCENIECFLQCMSDAIGDCYLTDKYIGYEMKVLTVEFRASCANLNVNVASLLMCEPYNMTCLYETNASDALIAAIEYFNNTDYAMYREAYCNYTRLQQTCISADITGSCNATIADFYRSILTVSTSLSVCGNEQSHEYFKIYNSSLNCVNPYTIGTTQASTSTSQTSVSLSPLTSSPLSTASTLSSMLSSSVSSSSLSSSSSSSLPTQSPSSLSSASSSTLSTTSLSSSASSYQSTPMSSTSSTTSSLTTTSLSSTSSSALPTTSSSSSASTYQSTPMSSTSSTTSSLTTTSLSSTSSSALPTTSLSSSASTYQSTPMSSTSSTKSSSTATSLSSTSSSALPTTSSSSSASTYQSTPVSSTSSTTSSSTTTSLSSTSSSALPTTSSSSSASTYQSTPVSSTSSTTSSSTTTSLSSTSSSTLSTTSSSSSASSYQSTPMSSTSTSVYAETSVSSTVEHITSSSTNILGCSYSEILSRLGQCLTISMDSLNTSTAEQTLKNYCDEVECNLQCYINSVGECYNEDQFFDFDTETFKVSSRLYCNNYTETLSAFETCYFNDQSCLSNFNSALITDIFPLYSDGNYMAYRQQYCSLLSTLTSCLSGSTVNGCSQQQGHLFKDIYSVSLSYSKCGEQNHAFFSTYGYDVTCGSKACLSNSLVVFVAVFVTLRKFTL